jgi:hypothetical protein
MSSYRSDEVTVWVWDEYERTYIKWRSADHWNEIRVRLKEHFPQHGALSYNATRKLWSVPLWRRPALEDWLSWTFEPSAIVWDEEPAGEYGRSYSRSGYSQYRERQTGSSTIEAAYAELHLLPTAPPELVQAAHRILIKRVHPDRGGNHEQAVELNRAWELVRGDLERRSA